MSNENIQEADDAPESVEALLQLFKLFREYKVNLGIVPTWLVKKLLHLGKKTDESFGAAGIEFGQFGKKVWVAGPDLKKAIGKRFAVLGSPVCDKAASAAVKQADQKPRASNAGPRRNDFAPGWESEEFWTYAQVGRWAACSRRHIERAAGLGDLTKIPRGAHIRFRSAEVKQWAKSRGE